VDSLVLQEHAQVWLRKWRSDVVRVRSGLHGIAKPRRDSEGHISELPFWVAGGAKEVGR